MEIGENLDVGRTTNGDRANFLFSATTGGKHRPLSVYTREREREPRCSGFSPVGLGHSKFKHSQQYYAIIRLQTMPNVQLHYSLNIRSINDINNRLTIYNINHSTTTTIIIDLFSTYNSTRYNSSPF